MTEKLGETKEGSHKLADIHVARDQLLEGSMIHNHIITICICYVTSVVNAVNGTAKVLMQ